MRKNFFAQIFVIALILPVATLVSCRPKNDPPPEVQINGTLYFCFTGAQNDPPVTPEKGDIVGYISSWVDGIPSVDDQTNVIRLLDHPYARVDGNYYILYFRHVKRSGFSARLQTILNDNREWI